MAKAGLFGDHPSIADMQARITENFDHYYKDTLWQSFRQWVKSCQPQEDWIQVKNLRQKSLAEVVTVTPDVIVGCLQELEDMLLSVGIMEKNQAGKAVLLEEQAHRVCTTDEKGLSQRQDEVSKGVVPRDMRHKAAATGVKLGFSHLTICSFLPIKRHEQMSSHLPVGVVVPFAGTTPDMQKAWPTACIRANQSGSISAAIFAEFVEQCWLLPMRRHVPLAQELVLICDSGGGCWLHVSPELCIVAERHRCRIFLLPAYSTKALCSLDQAPHQLWAREWSRTKSQWNTRHGSMNIQQALLCCSKISEMALTDEKARQAYHACGIDIAQPLNRDKLLIERSQEIFGSVRAHASEAPDLQSKNKRAFDCLATMTPPKTKCSGCGHRMEIICRLCPECGQENTAFDESLHSIYHSKRRAGWKKNLDWAAAKA